MVPAGEEQNVEQLPVVEVLLDVRPCRVVDIGGVVERVDEPEERSFGGVAPSRRRSAFRG